MVEMEFKKKAKTMTTTNKTTTTNNNASADRFDAQQLTGADDMMTTNDPANDRLKKTAALDKQIAINAANKKNDLLGGNLVARRRRTCWDRNNSDMNIAVVTRRSTNPEVTNVSQRNIVFGLKVYGIEVACFADVDEACQLRDKFNSATVRTQDGEGVLDFS